MATHDKYENDILKTLKRIATALEKIEMCMRKDQLNSIDNNEEEEESDDQI